VPHWSGLPDGWSYNHDDGTWRGGSNSLCVRLRPTNSVTHELQKVNSAKGSLARAEELLGGNKPPPPRNLQAVPEPKMTDMKMNKKETIGESESKKIVKEKMKKAEEEAERVEKKRGGGGGC